MTARCRTHVVTGKGGVGKTTVSLALGLRLSKRGGRVLVLDLGPGLGASAALDRDVGHEPRAIAAGLDVSGTDPSAATDDLLLSLSPSKRAARRLLRVPSLRAFVGAAPGALEVATLFRLETFAASGRYDHVVLDADSTGHLRMLLDAPGVLSTVGVSGAVRRTIDAVSERLADPERCRFHVVALPTSLALEESAELVRSLEARAMPLGTLFVSRAPPRLAANRSTAAALAERVSPAREDLLGLVATLDARERLDRFLAATGPLFRRVVERRTDEAPDGPSGAWEEGA